eukprot:CAMPEP_0179202676 /NCGR_PEP_ID=MMETSP0796-20121207/100969_1 /TAXON_ID=73915 /ORGANISM="Pyrodinium bahamense, Strain pbaha01" /LENGTH=38 /DNA_ID= /DNA_START= /DNA_END= /DNA_ORIENTATION=
MSVCEMPAPPDAPSQDVQTTTSGVASNLPESAMDMAGG